MKTTIEELKETLKNSRKFNIWNNPKTKGKSTEFDNCEYCGKKVGKNPLYVHVTYVGTCLPNDVTEEEINQVEESQGCFPIGPECAKLLFGSEILKYTKTL